MGVWLFIARLLTLVCLYGLAFLIARTVWTGMPAANASAGAGTVQLTLMRGVGPITTAEGTWAEGRRLSLQLPVSFGRQIGNTVQIEDPFVSSCHAELITDGTALWLVDRGSKNGTWSSGRRLERPLRLSPGQEFKLGGTTIRFEG